MDLTTFHMLISIYILCFLSYASPFLVGSSSTHLKITQTTPSKPKNICQLPESQRTRISGGCNFNNGTCGYEFPAELWNMHTEDAGMIMFGKVDDDSDNGIKQKFALFLTYYGHIPINTTSAIITTPVNEHNVCLKFWYLIPNQNSELQVYVTDEKSQSSSLVWETSHQQTTLWHKVEIPINRQAPFVVSFESTKENNFGYVGLDSILFDIETPPTTVSSTATINTPTTPTTATKPTTTFRAETTEQATPTNRILTTTDEKFTSAAQATPTNRILTTVSVKDTSAAMVSTPVYDVKTTETVLDETTATPEITTEATTEQTTTACQCKCPTPPASSNCQTTTPSSNTQTNAGTSAPLQVCNINPDKTSTLNGSCDFNKDVCGYTVPLYPHLWELTSYRYTYGSPDVGEITGDHSVDSSGGYIVFNTNNKHVQNGASGEVTSVPMFTNSSACMEFWYNMPNSLAILEVYLLGGAGYRNLLWRRTGATSGWVKATVQIHFTGTFQVSFLSRKTAKEGFVGIDDIAISIGSDNSSTTTTPYILLTTHKQTTPNPQNNCNCVCPTYSAVENCPSSITQTTSNPLCSSKIVMTNVSCDFDTGPCAFKIPMYPHLWEITRYGYGNTRIGVIDGDHTSRGENGMYAVFGTNNFHVQFGSHGEMTSHTIQSNITICITFWYNMPTDKATLNIYKRYENHSFSDELLWKQSHTETKGWKEASIVIQSNETFQVVFSSTKLGLDGYFGIDDVVIHHDAS